MIEQTTASRSQDRKRKPEPCDEHGAFESVWFASQRSKALGFWSQCPHCDERMYADSFMERMGGDTLHALKSVGFDHDLPASWNPYRQTFNFTEEERLAEKARGYRKPLPVALEMDLTSYHANLKQRDSDVLQSGVPEQFVTCTVENYEEGTVARVNVRKNMRSMFKKLEDMGKVIVISGPSNSGKSRAAATMVAGVSRVHGWRAARFERFSQWKSRRGDFDRSDRDTYRKQNETCMLLALDSCELHHLDSMEAKAYSDLASMLEARIDNGKPTILCTTLDRSRFIKSISRGSFGDKLTKHCISWVLPDEYRSSNR